MEFVHIRGREAGITLALSLTLVLGLSPVAAGQALEAGALTGRVTDQTGGVIVDASVSVQGEPADRRTAVTDGQGRYSFDGLAAGPYSLTVSAPGFLLFGAPVEIRPARTITLDVSMRIGISVSLDVTEPQGLSADPRRNQSAMVLTGRALDSLPDDPRLMLARLLEMAGSTGRRGDVAVYVDGFREYKRLPPKTTIEMIRINSNPFSAEFSQPSAKRIEITTRPGSDRYHGDVRFQARSSRLDSRNPLSDAKPQSEYRNYNGYLQGPLRKDRVGFLLYAGQWHQDENAFVNATVLAGAPLGAQPFSATVSTPTKVGSVMLKGDFTIFDQVVNASYSRSMETARNQGLDGGFDLGERAFDRHSTDDIGRIWWTSLGRGSVNDLRLEVTRGVASTSARSDAPAVLVLDAFNAGGNEAAGAQTTAWGLQATETLTLLRGRHTFKTGVQFDSTDRESVDRTGFNGAFTFGADVERDAGGAPVLDAEGRSVWISPIERYRRTLLGLAGYRPSQFTINGGDPAVGVTQWSLGWFALDDWSISKRVSFSYGVRQEAQNNVGWRPNLAPRGALSWLVDPAGNNAVKLGAGLFYSAVDPAITLDTRRLDGRRRRQIVVGQPTFFPTAPSAAGLDSAASPVSTIYTKARDLRVPRTLVATASYERQFPRGVVGVAQYQYARGMHLLRLRNLTAPTGATAAAVPPVLQFESTGRSRQHEMMLGLRGDAGARLSLFGNYRLGTLRSDTDGAYSIPANSNDLAAEYGAASDDRRHQLVAGATITLPGGVLVEPALSVLSGRPFNITIGRDDNGDTLFLDRPAFARPGDPNGIATPFGVFDPNPSQGATIVPRNFGREPWQSSLDLSVSKTLSAGVTITGDVQNLLNNDRFIRFNGVLTSPVFGEPNQALNARRFEVTVRYGF